MRFLKLGVHNWGVFRDSAEFSLEPIVEPDGSSHRLTIVSGHNGAGKSTLFQAMLLALHGSLALGDRVSQRAYEEFLSGRLHRYSEDGEAIVSDKGGVSLDFRYVQSGQRLDIRVERQWRRSGDRVREDLRVIENGQPPEVDPADYQTWLNDLVPPGLAPLCFFDGEQLNALANPERHNGLLGEMLRRLLGLDLVGRLQDDLTYYLRHYGSGYETSDLQEEVLQEQAILDDLNARLGRLRSELESLGSERASLQATLARQERRLAAEGGAYAERRPDLKRELRQVSEEIEDITEQLRELSGGLLPFALAPELCARLSQRLMEERRVRRRRAANETWQERVKHLQEALQGEELWADLDLSPATRHSLSERLTRMLREEDASGDGTEQPFVHHLAEPEEEQLRAWITAVLGAVPREVQVLGDRLDRLQKRRHLIEKALSRAPDDEVLAPIHEKITHTESALAELEKRERKLTERIGALEFQRDEQMRELERADERLRDAQANQRQTRLAARSQLVLKSYEDALVRQRLGLLEEELVGAFNAVCRKEHLLRAAHVNVSDFEVRLHGTDGHALGLGDFSAGERQLYAMALLSSLRRVSGWELPLVIDSPLARLDEVHRRRLVHDYLPAVSPQVVLFVTDTELDDELMAQIEPYCGRLYLLDYDPQSERTLVTPKWRSRPNEVLSDEKQTRMNQLRMCLGESGAT